MVSASSILASQFNLQKKDTWHTYVPSTWLDYVKDTNVSTIFHYIYQISLQFIITQRFTITTNGFEQSCTIMTASISIFDKSGSLHEQDKYRIVDM